VDKSTRLKDRILELAETLDTDELEAMLADLIAAKAHAAE
jgi:hypothetical protein